jgi:hypothetical protein
MVSGWPFPGHGSLGLIEALSRYDTILDNIGGCLTRAEAALKRTRFSSRPESPQGLAPLAGEVARTNMEERDL